MFAGPNGSGKSTIKDKIAALNRSWLGVYVNPDEIEKEIGETGHFNFGHFKIKTTEAQVIRFLQSAQQLVQNKLDSQVAALTFHKNTLNFEKISLNSYYVSALADFLHEKLISSRITFSFETVMSHTNKIKLLEKASRAGFRNYLYYVATEDPEINIARIRYRVETGGHNVPPHKTRERYYRSLDNLTDAIRNSDRAYIFDNSGARSFLVAEIASGNSIEIKNQNIPAWFKKYVLDRTKAQSLI